MIERAIVTRARLVFLLLAGLLCASSALASEPLAAAASVAVEAVNANGEAIALPAPPGRLAALIAAGKVRFEFYDADVAPRSAAAETHFEFRYSYKSVSNWKLVRPGGTDAVEISVRYRDVRLHRTHRMLLPDTLIREDLFEKPLTLHEFDHVAISSDPRLPALLKSMLHKRNASIVKVLNEHEDGFTGRPTLTDLSRISERAVQVASDQVFNEFVDLVGIRYRELDRASQSGLKPLSPEDRFRIIESATAP